MALLIVAVTTTAAGTAVIGVLRAEGTARALSGGLRQAETMEAAHFAGVPPDAAPARFLGDWELTEAEGGTNGHYRIFTLVHRERPGLTVTWARWVRSSRLYPPTASR